MSKQQRVELARTLCAADSPVNKSQVARALNIARSSLYVQTKRPKLDKALAVRIEEAHEKDDTMGHRKLAALLGTGKNRVKRGHAQVWPCSSPQTPEVRVSWQSCADCPQ